MTFLFLAAILTAGPAFGRSKDRDQNRKVAEGHQPYLGARLAVGVVAEAYLLQYPGHPDWQVSPSRYDVDFESASFRFRNQGDHAIPSALRGKWLTVVFEVVTVLETPVELPAGSGTWGWKLTYECDIKSVTESVR